VPETSRNRLKYEGRPLPVPSLQFRSEEEAFNVRKARSKDSIQAQQESKATSNQDQIPSTISVDNDKVGVKVKSKAGCCCVIS